MKWKSGKVYHTEVKYYETKTISVEPCYEKVGYKSKSKKTKPLLKDNIADLSSLYFLAFYRYNKVTFMVSKSI